MLEARIVRKMALLFGTTWVVNAVVGSGLLCLIVAANFVYGAVPKISLLVAYIGLFLSLAVMFFVPLEILFYESWLMRAIVARSLSALRHSSPESFSFRALPALAFAAVRSGPTSSDRSSEVCLNLLLYGSD